MHTSLPRTNYCCTFLCPHSLRLGVYRSFPSKMSEQISSTPQFSQPRPRMGCHSIRRILPHSCKSNRRLKRLISNYWNWFPRKRFGIKMDRNMLIPCVRGCFISNSLSLKRCGQWALSWIFISLMNISWFTGITLLSASNLISYLGHSYLLHNQQLERIKAHSQIHKKHKPPKSEGSYLEFLITRNAAMENMCKAYCAVPPWYRMLLMAVIYGIDCVGFASIAY